MPGSFTVSPPSVPLARPAKLVGVWRRTGIGKYELLPNVRVLSIEPPGEGANTGTARFRYSFGDPLGDPGDPFRVEHVYPLDATGQHVVNNDDRLVVRMFQDDGSSVLLFDGFVRTPQADLTKVNESVTFEAAGTPVREWDAVMGGATVRDAVDPTKKDEDKQVPVMRTRFNPDGHPNCSPSGADSGDTDVAHPVFLGPVWPANKINGSTIRIWTIKLAARYIVALGNPLRDFTDHRSLLLLTATLNSVKPVPDDGAIDWADPSTYETEDIEVEDLDVTQATWPEALEQLITPYGFAMRFYLEEEEGAASDDPTEPKWWLEIYRKDDLHRIKSLYLQRPGETYEPARTNVLELKLARDTSDVENLVFLDTAPSQYEASYLLMPGFHIAAGDAATPEAFEGDDKGDKYRVWVFDECGEGYWSIGGSNWVTGEPGDFAKVLTGEDAGDAPKFQRRRRPGIAKLISTDDQGEPAKAVLHYSKDYANHIRPGVWDPSVTGTWLEIKSSEWELLEDRLGIRIKSQKVTEVKVGEVEDGVVDPYDNGGILDLLTWYATPTADRPAPKLRLTCKIEGDEDLNVAADWRQAGSITERPISRIHDERERYRLQRISRYSALSNPEDVGTEDQDMRDDTDEAQAYADALRRAKEAGTFAGSVTLNGIRGAYDVGDRIDRIVGRDISLRMNLGETEGESPIYPTIVSLRWEFDGEQRTVLSLEDRRAEPPRRRQKARSD